MLSNITLNTWKRSLEHCGCTGTPNIFSLGSGSMISNVHVLVTTPCGSRENLKVTEIWISQIQWANTFPL